MDPLSVQEREENVVEDNTGPEVSMLLDSIGGEEGREMMRMMRKTLMIMMMTKSLRTKRIILTREYSNTMKLSWKQRISLALSSLRRQILGVRSHCLCGEVMVRGRNAIIASFVRISGSLFAHQALW